MGKITRIVPFSWWPANWGMVGKRREEAELEYYWEGEELQYKLLDVQFDDHSSSEYLLKKANLDYKYHKITPGEYQIATIEYNSALSSVERAKELVRLQHRLGDITAEELEYKLFEIDNEIKDSPEYIRGRIRIDLKYGKITDAEAEDRLIGLKFPDLESKEYALAKLEKMYKRHEITIFEYEKAMANINDEPWWNVISVNKVIDGNRIRFAFQLDWNDQFISFLESIGWEGHTSDDLINHWFSEAMLQYNEKEIENASELLGIASKITEYNPPMDFNGN